MRTCLIVADNNDLQAGLALITDWQNGPVCLLSAEEDFDELADFTTWLIYLPDSTIRPVLNAALAQQSQIMLLPHQQGSHTQRGFAINAARVSEQQTLAPVDVLRCNDEIVLNKLVLEKPFSFQPGGHQAKFGQRLKQYWQRFRQVNQYQLHRANLTTGAGGTLTTAATGITVTPHLLGSGLNASLQGDKFVNDRQFFTLIVSPKSLLGLAGFMVMQVFHRKLTPPSFLGILRTREIAIELDAEREYFIDEAPKLGKSLALKLDDQRLQLLTCANSPFCDGSERNKEMRKVAGLPSAKESIDALVNKPLPWLVHAATDEFRELYQQLRESASTTTGYVVMMLLSTLLAALGLFANSAPVIIGAMLLAPLMAPIVALGMALARQEEALLVSASKTLLTGVILALFGAIAVTLCIPMSVLTPEMAARVNPNLLDLGVAIISGIAGAYAHARSQVAKGIAGVAIAVALVPPLAVAGIGIGWFSWPVASGALLLFATNLAGIIFAAAVTFGMLGFAPFKRAQRGLALALSSILIIAIPLALSFQRMASEAQAIQWLQQHESANYVLRDIAVTSKGKTLIVQVKVVADSQINNQDMLALKRNLQTALDRSVVLEVEKIQRFK